MADKSDEQDDEKAEGEDPPKPRGFAAMTPEQRRVCASVGGKRAHAKGTAHQFTSESGSAAGRIAHARGTAYEWTSEQARDAGRLSMAITGRRRRFRGGDPK